MYSLPGMHNAEDRLKPADMDAAALCQEECTSKGQFPCDETVFELCCLLMEENGWDASTEPFSAVNLCILLRAEIQQNI